MLKIGNIKLKQPFFQASLSGYSDYAMRNLARRFGAELTFPGVMLAKIILSPKVLKKPIFLPAGDEHPIGAQIMGTDPEIMARAAKGLRAVGYDMIDLNFACPAPKVLHRGRGGALLKNPAAIRQITKQVRDAIDCPLTMKLRIGYDNSDESREKFWQICEHAAAGAIDALIIHDRHVKQRYRAKADWQIVYDVKNKFGDMTVIGSGDLFTGADVADRLQNGIDGVVIARGAVGNPWIFADAKAILNGDEPAGRGSLKSQGEIMMEHFEMARQIHGDRKVIGYFRKIRISIFQGPSHRKKSPPGAGRSENKRTVHRKNETILRCIVFCVLLCFL